MPSFCATAIAVVRLSPVSMTMAMPSAFSASSAWAVLSFTGSAMAMMPAVLPSTATKIAVAPSLRSFSACCSSDCVAMLSSPRNRALPSTMRRRPTIPIAPLPAGESKPRTEASLIFRSAAASTIALPSGCSLLRSMLAASRSTSVSSKPSAALTATTLGLPSVKVPALSTTSVFTASMRSSASALLIRTPSRAPRPTPTMIDMGVALHRRTRTLRCHHHLDDPRQHGVTADLIGAHDEPAAAIDRAADHFGARVLGHRHRLAGHHGFIECRMALDQFTIDRNLVTGPHPQPIADRDGFERHHLV